ncbi:hypothetical protein DQ04_06451000 [Trypanosoma grayi]|uniref:hypothetical protein n=1 Tax=Trypanosoma grayi TaxID=71804 RepID=UPI0004F47E87|nr:hypothetical protein DQ04_06451000 [Trypanosoma grayi]KEG08788.1 hypothetical protein DQ04_06451000 [Trypanosoma grayi]
MEENLRRLGLREETGVAAGDSARMKGPQEYIASIKAAKEDAMKLRHEKEYRQFAAEEQKRENEMMLSVVNKEKALQDVIKKAQLLLERETQNAQEVTSRRVRKNTERVLRAEELQKQNVLRERVHEALKSTFTSAPVFLQLTSAADEDARAARKAQKANAAREYCHSIAAGVVELSLKVAEGVYTTSCLSGATVHRMSRDLSMTQRRAWMDELVFPKKAAKTMSDVLATTTLRELRDPNYKSHSNHREETVSSSHVISEAGVREDAEDSRDGVDGGNRTAATGETIIGRIAEMQMKYEKGLISRGVADAVHIIRQEEEKKLRVALDELRRQHESQCHEEAAPGWMHRLPPAGCFVYGDELSGLKVLADTLGNDSTHDAPPSQTKRRGSAVLQADLQRSLQETDASKWEHGPYRILVPAMLIRTPQTAAGQGGCGSGGGSAAAGSKPTKGGSTVTSGTSRAKENKQTEDAMESKQYIDALCDALTKELIAVYQYNLQFVARKNSSSVSTPLASAASVRTLFLIGFPETETFWRTLHQKIHVAVEAVEQEMNKALKGEEVNEEPHPQPLPKMKSSYKPAAGQDGGGKTRKKNSKHLMSPGGGKKSATRPSVTWNEEDLTPPRCLVYPPLCLLGVFLQYDVSARYRRMQAACQFNSPISQGQRSNRRVTIDDEGGVDSCAEWSKEKLRHELIHQDRKMRHCWEAWCANVSKPFAPHEPEIERVFSNEKLKKRSRPSLILKACEPVSTNLAAPPALLSLPFPKVLFFLRKEDTTLETRLDRPAESLVTALKAVLHPTVHGVTKNEGLVPGQLTAPLRLSDYRFPPATLAQLVAMHQQFHTRWDETAAAVTATTSKQLSREASGKEGENTAVAEMEMHRAFRTFSTDLLRFMTHQLFPPSLWTSTTQRMDTAPDASGSGGADVFGRTVHFMSVDGNYDSSRDALYTLLVDGMSRLSATSALLLRCALDVALASMGEALERLCVWVHSHIVHAPTFCPEAEKNAFTPTPTCASHAADVATPSNNNAINHITANTISSLTDPANAASSPVKAEEVPLPERIAAAVETTKQSFLATVPRLTFEEVQAMVEHLDGQVESFAEFQRVLWLYASHVHATALDCFRVFVRNVSTTISSGSSVSLEGSGSIEAIAPRVTEVLLAYLLAFAPEEAGECMDRLTTSKPISSSAISVPIGRVVAAIRALRRCCTVAGFCAARWVDAMYATALTVSPHGSFPAHCRPTDITDIFTPPVLVAQAGTAPPPSLMLQRLSKMTPPFGFTPEEERDCWYETEMEIVLQHFSMYQTPMLEQEEFCHCLLQSQLSTLWSCLPPKVHMVAERLGISLPFQPRFGWEDGKQTDERSEEFSGVKKVVSWWSMAQCIERGKLQVVTEEMAVHIFHRAVRSQMHALPNEGCSFDVATMPLMPSASAETVPGQRSERPMLHLREFFASIVLQRLCFADTEACPCRATAAQEPSTMEIRAMVKSLPRAVREQGCGDVPGTAPITARDWKRIKWWNFFPSQVRAKSAAFIQRYLLRILTVCFGFVNGELCSRCVPFLPDMLSIVARTNGAQATVERYFHALAALNVSRKKKLNHSQKTDNARNAPTDAANTASVAPTANAVASSSVGESTTISDGPLMVFDIMLTVEEALFYFQRANEATLRGPCAIGVGHGFPYQRREQYCAGHHEDDNTNVEDDSLLLPLEAELTLLLEVENSAALSLPLLCSSHWGQPITPRLTVIPPEPSIPAVTRGSTARIEEKGANAFQMSDVPTEWTLGAFI